MSHSFSPIVSPYLFQKITKKKVNLSGHDGQADKKISHVIENGFVSIVPINKTSGSSLGNRQIF